MILPAPAIGAGGPAPVSSPSSARLGLVLGIAVLAMSSSAVLVRLMDASPLVIAAWRMIGACLLMSPFARRLPSLADTGRLAVAGALLALHFGTWFAAVQSTTILRAAVLVALVPVWTGLAEWVTGRPPSGRFFLGVGLALFGVAGLASGGGSASWTGDALAIVAGLAYAAVLALTQGLRQRLDAPTTTAWLCGWAAVSLIFSLVWTETSPVVNGSTGLAIVAAVLGPQLIGHQGVAWVVRWVPASRVSAALLLEPVGSTVLAAVVLGEQPSASAAVAGILIVGGVFWAASPARHPGRDTPPPRRTDARRDG